VAGVLFAILVPGGSSAGTAEELEVRPGGVVVWAGEGAHECVMGGKSWTPREGSCWYPIDLDTPAGSLQVGRKREGRWEERAVRVSEYPYSVQHITLKDDSKVDLSAADLSRVRQESARIGALWDLATPVLFELPLGSPLQELPDGGRFGSRRTFNNQPRSPHSGADFSVPAGTPVLTVADGLVALAGDFFFSGRSVFIDHGGGLVSMYFHFTDIEVQEGQQVARGERIGTVGRTGRATGPHLHFGLRWRRARVDPDILLGPVSAIPSLSPGARNP